MVRVLNFFCVALMGLSILGLYHVSEKTRMVRLELAQTTHAISDEHATISVLQTEWSHVTTPDRIQQLAQDRLGMTDGTSVQLSSFEELPRRGDAPLENSPVHDASAQVAQPAQPQPIQISVRSGSTSAPGM